MAIAIVIAFIIGYSLIAFEKSVNVDKAASALATGVICWIMLTFGFEFMPSFAEASAAGGSHKDFVLGELSHHLSGIAEILFFLLGAMTIVELVDVHEGFRVITDRIKTTNKVKLLWIIGWITFILSSMLDNMTTAIIMCALLRKIIQEKEDRWLFGGFVIIAANAGGAWSPIGDVTTIMLWIGGQVTTFAIMKSTFFASVLCMFVPLLFATYLMRKDKALPQADVNDESNAAKTPKSTQVLMFTLGTIGLLWVPVFKAWTHMPPYMGILLSVAVVWFVTEFLHRDKEEEIKKIYSVSTMLHRIDTPSILFFLGILLAVAALNSSGHLNLAADFLNENFGNVYAITASIGALSAIVDNVPLVAACMGMYDLATVPPDSDFWDLLAYCAGTGGSMLIIGSAAGVASMGILGMDFMWYLKRISFYAAVGYVAGIVGFYLQHHFLL